MDSSFRSRKSSFSLFVKSDFDRGCNFRRRSCSPLKYYHSNFSESRFNYIELKARENYLMSASLSRRRSRFEDYNHLQYYSSSKYMQYSNDSESCSVSRNIRMNSPYQSLDVLLSTRAKRIKEMNKNLPNSESEGHFCDLKTICPEKYKTNRGTSKEKIDLTNVSKSSRNVSCFGKRQAQSLENDSLLFLARKSIKKSRKEKSTHKSKSAKRKNFKLCQDVPTDDTMILCIDDEEVAEILFGDFGPNKSEKGLTIE